MELSAPSRDRVEDVGRKHRHARRELAQLRCVHVLLAAHVLPCPLRSNAHVTGQAPRKGAVDDALAGSPADADRGEDLGVESAGVPEEVVPLLLEVL